MSAKTKRLVREIRDLLGPTREYNLPKVEELIDSHFRFKYPNNRRIEDSFNAWASGYFGKYYPASVTDSKVKNAVWAAWEACAFSIELEMFPEIRDCTVETKREKAK